MTAPTLNDETILTFPKGLLGFPNLTRFRIYEPPDGYPIKFLQAADDESVSFTCIDPAAIKQDYEFPLGEEEAQALGLEQPSDAMVLTLVVIPEDARKMTTNLAGPLVVNVKTRVGYQIVLNAEVYSLRHPVFPAS